MEKSTEKRLILVDGSSYLYRAYHAFPALSNPAGEPTGAMYGVLNMLRSLLLHHSAHYFAVIFDAPGKKMRHLLYAEYKSHRPLMLDALRVQIAPLYQMVEALGLPLLVIPQVEADDVIGTLASRAAAEGVSVLISTGDKDMAQLVSPRITLINTMTNSVQCPAEVEARYGVSSSLMVDFLALVGDSSDNIPGVPGIGPKKASALLNCLGNLEQIYTHLDQVEKMQIRGAKTLCTQLQQHRSLAELSYQLAKIQIDLPLPVAYSQLVLRTPHVAQLQTLFEHYAFKRWLAELQSGRIWHHCLAEVHKKAAPSLPEKDLVESHTLPHTTRNYTVIFTEEELHSWLEKLRAAERFALLIETDSVDICTAQLVGIAFAVVPGEAAYLPLLHDIAGAPLQLDHTTVFAYLQPLLSSARWRKVGQSLKFTCQVLMRYGIALQGVEFDTMLASYLLNSTAGDHDLVSLAQRYLNYTLQPLTAMIGRGAKQCTFNQLPLEQAAPYAAEKIDIVLRLYHHLWAQLIDHAALSHLLYTIELPLMHLLAQMEIDGVFIDSDQLRCYSQNLAVQMQTLEQEAYTQAGMVFNLASPKQLRHVLFERQGLSAIKKTPGGALSTDDAVLTELAQQHALPATILQYRTLAKLKSTYADKLPQMVNHISGRVHTSYHQAVTATGRLSSSDPNLQNIPIRSVEGRQIRQAFVASSGYSIVSADYSQIELRIMAHLAQDQRLLQAFREDHDIHYATAAEIFEIPLPLVTVAQRRSAKAINFGLIYGISAFGLARQLNVVRSKAQLYMDRYFARYPGVFAYTKQIREQARQQGYVETLWGRRLWVPEIQSPHWVRRQAAERAAINGPVQGSAADIIKKAMLAIAAWIQQQPTGQILMVMQVHDELIFEVQQHYVDIALTQIKQLMEQSVQLSIPLQVQLGVGSSWDQAH